MSNPVFITHVDCKEKGEKRDKFTLWSSLLKCLVL